MPAPKGNRFWEVRASHGRKPMFDTPDAMWKLACDYFEWSEDTPLYGEKLFAHQGEVIVGKFAKMRAMTVEGFCNYLGITSRCFRLYKEKEDFIPVIERIEQVMFEQKFSGAAADLLNANIIARDLGLADKQELTGKDGGAIEVKEDAATVRERARLIAFALTKAQLATDPVEG